MKKLIVITTPAFFSNEGKIITRLFEEGLLCLHFRKPGCSSVQLMQMLSEIPSKYYHQIVLHDCFDIALEQQKKGQPVKGIHLNKRNTSIPEGFVGSISCSCHSLEEIEENKKRDYVFLSPIFDSISKEGYGRRYTLSVLENASKEGLINEKVIALGGMDIQTIPLICNINFGGVAVLGAVWGQNPSIEKADAIMERYKQIQLCV